MIKSFRCKETEKTAKGIRSKKLPTDIQRVAYRKLRMIDNAVILKDLKNPPNNRFELLKGNRKGEHSIRINDQWRICFYWKNGAVTNVSIEDYHK